MISIKNDSALEKLSADKGGEFGAALLPDKNPIDVAALYLTESLPQLFPSKFPEGASISVIPLTQGSVNMTFLVTGGVEPIVCRASPNHDFGGNQNQHDSEWSQYHKEQHWQNTLRRDFPQLADKISSVEGVSYIASQVLLPELQRTAVSGTPSDLAVSIQTVASGTSPNKEQRLQVQEQLGQIASIINTVVPTGLGNRFDHKTGAFYTDKRWHTPSPAELVDWKIKNVELDTLVTNGTVSSSEAKTLSTLLQGFRDNADLSPCLVFGDMNIGCALVDGKGNVTGIVDFEGLRAGPGIYDQLSERYLKESQASYEAFARGYAHGLGLTEEQFAAKHQAHIVSAALLEFLPQFKNSLPNAQERSLLHRLINDVSVDDQPLSKRADISHPEFVAELNEMGAVDQLTRELAVKDPSVNLLNVDLPNTERLKEIIEKIGWPTASKVGLKASQYAWLIAQHADHDVPFQKLAFGLMEGAAAGEVIQWHIAYLQDRILVNQNMPQIYGSQGRKPDGVWNPLPIENEGEVDKRRAAVGLAPLKEYTQIMNTKGI